MINTHLNRSSNSVWPRWPPSHPHHTLLCRFSSLQFQEPSTSDHFFSMSFSGFSSTTKTWNNGNPRAQLLDLFSFLLTPLVMTSRFLASNTIFTWYSQTFSNLELLKIPYSYIQLTSRYVHKDTGPSSPLGELGDIPTQIGRRVEEEEPVKQFSLYPPHPNSTKVYLPQPPPS